MLEERLSYLPILSVENGIIRYWLYEEAIKECIAKNVQK